jgi:membrane protease YdiL (CAAX protease family)
MALQKHSRASGARRISFVLVGLVSVWFLLMRQFGGSDIYSVLGPYALAVVAVLWLLRPHKVAYWLTPELKPIVIGVVIGVAMTLATYPVFHLAARWIPGLDSYVGALYRSAATAPLHVELGWVAVIIVAEELLWRGCVLEALERKLPATPALLACVAVYTLAQLGSGSWVVGAMAAVCGLIWTLERKWTDSLLAPLISHLIWTPTVILLHPVT